MADLEPYVGMCERAGGIAEDTIEAGQRIIILALLLVDDAKSEENFIGLVKI